MKFHCSRVIILFIGFFGLFHFASAQQVTDAFNVRVFDSYIRVIAPSDYHREQSVVIENRTMTKLVGKVETGSGDVVAFVSVNPDKFQAVSIELGREEKLFFIPLSPGLPEAELIIGRKSYEVPPQDKN